MPPLHPIVIHFPIALFIVFALFDVSLFVILLFNREKRNAFKREKSKLSPASEIILLLSIAGAWVAVATGLILKSEKASFLPDQLLNIHEFLAIAFAALITLLAVFRLRSHWRPTVGYTFLVLFCVALLFYVGHTGGSMVWHPAGEALSSKNVSGSKAAKPKDQPNKAPSNNKGSQSDHPSKKPNPQPSQPKQTPQTQPKTSSPGTSSSTKPKSSPNTQQPQINQREYTIGQTHFRQSCSRCHGLNVSKNRVGVYSESQWQQVVRKMNEYANGSIPDTQAIVYYLSHLQNK